MSRPHATDLMQTDLFRLSGDTPTGEVIDRLLEGGKRSDLAVLCDGDRLEGLFTLMSALEALTSGAAAAEAPAREFAQEAPALDPRDDLYHVLSCVVASKADASPVIEDGKLLGVVFLTDIFDQITEKALVDLSFDPHG